MKKTNFVVIFWLTLALIFTVVLLVNLSGIFTNFSYILIPAKEADAFMTADDVKRSLLVNVPMACIGLGGMIFATRTGIKMYNQV